MGRAARAKAAAETTAPVEERFQVSPEDYWKLMSLTKDLELVTAKAKAAVQAADQVRLAHLRAIAAKHPGFQVENTHYHADDASCTLTRRVEG